MRIFSLISGWYFCDLQAHGKEMDQVIARGDSSLVQHSTPELERWFDKPPAELPRQSGFPLAFALLFFLIAFACNWLTLMALLPKQTPPVRAFLFFVPGILFIVGNLSASYLIARGKTSGLRWYGCVHATLTVLSVVLLVLVLLNGKMHHAILMLASLLVMLACRHVLNGRGFILFVLYCRTQRMTTLSRRMRLKSRHKK